jgi:CheY-like chemotaxis protein
MLLSFEEFETQLTYVLQHLYDPSLTPPAQVLQVLGHTPQDGLEVLQTVIIQMVEDLRPADYVPKSTRSWRVYGILYYRFISNLTQEDVANRVGITPRHLRREQAGAVHLLALRLWEKAHLPLPPTLDEEPEPEETGSAESGLQNAPELQLQNDLVALQENAPGVISDVSVVVRSVLTLVNRIPTGERMEIGEVVLPPELKAALHPSVLRQVVWMMLHVGITRLEQGGKVSIVCGVQGTNVYIELKFSPVFAFDDQQKQIIEEILKFTNGKLEIQEENQHLVCRVEILHVNRTVLIVDDNPDIVHLYRRYLIGTQYYLNHLANGQELFEHVKRIHPDLIVLDIMLPDVDGWELLIQLTENPDTRRIPVIVCSVMSDKDLAMALGANTCLAKPVQRADFIHALDRASSQI